MQVVLTMAQLNIPLIPCGFTFRDLTGDIPDTIHDLVDQLITTPTMEAISAAWNSVAKQPYPLNP